jgi:hypothetical protein
MQLESVPECTSPIFFPSIRSECDGGHASTFWATRFPNPLHQAVTIHVRHRHVNQQDVRIKKGELGQGLGTACRNRHRRAMVPEH